MPPSPPLSVFTLSLLARGAVLLWVATLAPSLQPFDASHRLPPAAPAGSLRPAQARCSPREACPWDAPVLSALLPLAHWDGAYFVHLAEALPRGAGYAHESFYAFLPGYPALLALARALLLWPAEALGLLSPRPALLLAGALLGPALCAAAALALERLSLRVLRSRRLARASALAFAVTPGGVFFTALYTEALFALLTFSALALLEGAAARAEDAAARARAPPPPARTLLRLLSAAALLAAASAVRSNGALNAGFVAWAVLRVAAAGARSGGCSSSALAACALGGALAALAPLLPLPLLQWHAASRFCPGAAWCRPSDSPTAGPGSSSGSLLRALASPPPLYAHIQAQYWGVGWLQRWTLAQAPQFILGLPMTLCAAAAALAWARAALARPAQLLLLRPLPSRLLRLAPYTAHWAALTLAALTVAHPQVTTRLCAAACPPVYWLIASVWCGREEEGEGEGGGRAAGQAPARGGEGLESGEASGGLLECPAGCRSSACRAGIAIWVLGYTLIGGGLFAGTVNWT